MRRISSHLLLFVTAFAGIVSSACQSGGVGDPCIPEDEYRKDFPGYSATEVNVESRSFQCETRVCLAANFTGRVSCPYGQQAAKGTTQVDPALPAEDRCYLPGQAVAPQNQITAPVPAQLVARRPEQSVYCSCRCDGPDKNVRYCECPSGYVCQELVKDYGFGSGQLAGSYCIKDGTQVKDPTALAKGATCVLGDPNCPANKHPFGI